MVRAKFKVQEVTRSRGGHNVRGADGMTRWEDCEVQRIKLSPVTSGSPENEAFYSCTPGGSIELSTVVASAAAEFDIGKEFYVDFTPADPAVKQGE